MANKKIVKVLGKGRWRNGKVSQYADISLSASLALHGQRMEQMGLGPKCLV